MEKKESRKRANELGANKPERKVNLCREPQIRENKTTGKKYLL